MKRASMSVLLMLVASSITIPQTKTTRVNRGSQPKKSTADVEQALKDVERQRAEAFKNRDKPTLSRLLDEQFIFTDDAGQVLNKAQYIDVAMRGINVESYNLDELTVRVFGDTGVVAGLWAGKMTKESKDASATFRFTDTFVKRLARWRVVASQETRIAAPPGAEVRTPSGLKYVDLVVGAGEVPKPGQMVTVHYTGWLENGIKFDSSQDSGRPFSFQIGVGRVIRGWDEGVMTMRVGGKRKLIIPPQLGYADRGAGDGRIPPNATLIFEVTLLSVK